MRYINIDDITKTDLITKFTNYINTARFTKATIDFTARLDQNLPKDIKKPTVYINDTAYLKMMLYVRDTDTEIAWHGTVIRNLEENYYYIEDVFLYPQKVTGTTVQTDQDKYNAWMENLEDNIYNNLRFQGHSHVNMGTTPSGTDLTYYNDILQVLPKTDFYIFAIMNKSGSLNMFVYDLAQNIIFDKEDLNIKIVTPDTSCLLEDINDEKEDYCHKHTYVTPLSTEYNKLSKTHKEILGKTLYPDEYDDEEDFYKYYDHCLSACISTNKTKGRKKR